MANKAGEKKFVIKPYQQHSTMNKVTLIPTHSLKYCGVTEINSPRLQDGALETWASLDSAITQIHQQNASSLSFEELYRHEYP